jgi:hypothetical protein
LRLALRLLVAGVLLGLAGCDLLGLESASDIAARKEAEGKAVGGACRHAARSIEECYEQNKRADKAAVFAGWREMNDYMRENNLEAMPARPRGEAQVAEADTGPAREEGGAAEAPAAAASRPDAARR